MKHLNFNYDNQTDVLTVEGIGYSGDMFRDLGFHLMIGEKILFSSREDGVLVLESAED